MKIQQIELARGASLAYKGYLITRSFLGEGYFVTKDEFRICSPATLAAAKAAIDELTSGD